VDDNSLNRQLVQGYFEGTHHVLNFAADGVEGIAQVQSNRPDIILMDLRMPRMDGRAALAEIRKIDGAEILPVVAVTASSLSTDETLLKGLFAGFLRKPFNRTALFRELAGFFPRQVAAAPEGRNGMADSASEEPADWSGLLPTLRKLVAGPWVGVRDGGAINETRSFGQRLTELGRTFKCRPLVKYGETLVEEADNFAVDRMTLQVAEFPALLHSLEEIAGMAPR